MYVNVLSPLKVRDTRFAGIGYYKVTPTLWRICDTDSDPTGYTSAVGPHYRTQTELLADLDNYATEYGATAR